MSDKTVPKDMLLQIRMQNAYSAENVSSVTKIVHAIFDPLLRKCPTGKWVKIPTISPTSLDYLIRVDGVVKPLRVTPGTPGLNWTGLNSCTFVKLKKVNVRAGMIQIWQS
jgi:hypothetical protein